MQAKNYLPCLTHAEFDTNMVKKKNWDKSNLCVVKLGLDVERLHHLELEKLPEVEFALGGRVVEHLANQNVSAEFLHLSRKNLLFNFEFDYYNYQNNNIWLAHTFKSRKKNNGSTNLEHRGCTYYDTTIRPV